MKQTPYSTETVLWTEFLIQSGFDATEALTLRGADLAENPPTGIDLLQLKRTLDKVESWLMDQWGPLEEANPYFDELKYRRFQTFLVSADDEEEDLISTRRICGALQVWLPESEIPIILPERFGRYPMPPGRIEQPDVPFVAEILPGAYIVWSTGMDIGVQGVDQFVPGDTSYYNLPRPGFHRNLKEALREAQSILKPGMSDRFVALTPEEVDAQIDVYETTIRRLDQERQQEGWENLRRAFARNRGDDPQRPQNPIAERTPQELREVRDEIRETLLNLELDDHSEIRVRTIRLLYAMLRQSRTLGYSPDLADVAEGEDVEDEDADDPAGTPADLRADTEDT